MEVATILADKEDVAIVFGTFINAYPLLCLVNKDNDTAYFEDIRTGSYGLYVYYELNDAEHELDYNYLPDDAVRIREFYKEKQLYMFDISYRSENILDEVLLAFKEYLRSIDMNEIPDILISHPHYGIIELNKK